jgi:hypothetical protein
MVTAAAKPDFCGKLESSKQRTSSFKKGSTTKLLMPPKISWTTARVAEYKVCAAVALL